MNVKKSLLLLFSACVLAHAAPDATTPKWHPGHYVLVGGEKLTTEALTLPHFRGVQKIYTWRDFEPVEGRFDFSELKADLELVRKHGRQIVVQFTFKSFAKGTRNVPDYLTGPKFGGGVYRTVKGAFNPVLWNEEVAARFDAVLIALGQTFDGDPNLEAVNLPESAPNARLDTTPQEGVEPYTEQRYFEALKRQMTTLRHAFPHTALIQYTNFPPKLLVPLTDFEKEIGVGLGGPDVYPRADAVSDPETGIYRLYAKLAGTVPLGAAVQSENYSVAAKKRSRLNRGLREPDGSPIIITAEDERPIPVREHLQLAKEKLKLNYLFWSATPAKNFAAVVKMLAEPDLAADPAGGLVTAIPRKVFAP